MTRSCSHCCARIYGMFTLRKLFATLHRYRNTRIDYAVYQVPLQVKRNGGFLIAERVKNCPEYCPFLPSPGSTVKSYCCNKPAALLGRNISAALLQIVVLWELTKQTTAAFITCVLSGIKELSQTRLASAWC